MQVETCQAATQNLPIGDVATEFGMQGYEDIDDDDNDDEEEENECLLRGRVIKTTRKYHELEGVPDEDHERWELSPARGVYLYWLVLAQSATRNTS